MINNKRDTHSLLADYTAAIHQDKRKEMNTPYMKRFKALAVQAAIDRLFDDKSFFDICILDDIVKLSGREEYVEDQMKAFRLIHCVSYEKMSPELITELRHAIKVLLRTCNHEWSEYYVPDLDVPDELPF